MKLLKFSSIFLLGILFMGMTIPEAEAKHCKHGHCKRSRSSSFGLSLNFGNPALVVTSTPAPTVVAAPTYPSYAVAPTYVAASTYGYPAYVAAPAAAYPAYPYYAAPVVVQRQTQSVFVQPGFSYSYQSY